jgi:hypothetical protein
MSFGDTLRKFDSRFTRRDKIIIGFAVIGVTITYLVINRAIKIRLLNKINEAIDTGVGLNASSDDVVNNNAFDVNFYKTTPSKYASRLLKNTEVLKYVERIQNVEESGENIVSIFDEFDSKAQVSQVSAMVKIKYGESLRDMLQDIIDTKNQVIASTSINLFGYTIGGTGLGEITDMLARIDAIVKSLPNY